jgi:methionyl-tRNA formyltransferase
LKIHAAERTEGTLEPGLIRAVAGEVMIGTGDGTLLVREVQLEGKSRIAASAWANGAQFAANEVLGDG